MKESTQTRSETSPADSPNGLHRRGSPTLDDSDVHVASIDKYDSSEAIISTLLDQETRDPLDESNCCNGGDKGFRTYKTDLPVIRTEDIKPGRLIYRPTTNPLHVYEITSEPYVNKHGSRKVDVTVHSRSHSGEDPEIRSREETLFTASVIDEMTFIQPETVQKTL